MSERISAVLKSYLENHVMRGKVIDRTRQEGILLTLKDYFGDMTEKDLTPKEMARYAKKRGVHSNTIRRELVTLRAAYRVAMRDPELDVGDVPVFEIPDEIRPPERWLKKSELKALIEAADEGLRDFIYVAYFTAGRKDSVTRLTRPQIDLEQKRINLALPGERQRNKKRPIVPIFPDIQPIIERRYAANHRLFPDMASVNRRFGQAVEKAGLEGRVTPHTLRHSRATHLLQAGADVWAVAKLLGDTAATVERVYGHHCPDYLAQTLS